ncbi:MAG: sigma-70 family RNA polymerase sigma factor [Deltaproteobacteria bacterium]|nr:sigma-70 family RNA polymerase sigma factor [Deltaproteobacteria bacterium]
MARFASTRWSLIARARADDAVAASEAFGALFVAYRDPLYAFLRRSGASPEDALDRMQDLFAGMLARRDLERVAPERGRFRDWLLAAARHTLSNARDKERAAKRGGGAVPLSLDARAVEDGYALDPGHDLTPEKLYLRRFALATIAAALAALRVECEQVGKLARFEALRPALVGDLPEGGYQEIGASLGLGENAAKQEGHRLRTRFRELVRAQVADTLDDDEPAAVEAELRSLLAEIS